MLLTDYSFYINLYGGENIPSDSKFSRYGLRASNFINKVTFNRININDIPDEVQMAVCALSDAIYKNDQIGLKTTETVGNHTISYAQISDSDMDKKLYNLVKTYLPDELLYRGIY